MCVHTDTKWTPRIGIQVEWEFIGKLLGGLQDTAAGWPTVPCKAHRRLPSRTVYQRVELSSCIVMVSWFRPSLVLAAG